MVKISTGGRTSAYAMLIEILLRECFYRSTLNTSVMRVLFFLFLCFSAISSAHAQTVVERPNGDLVLRSIEIYEDSTRVQRMFYLAKRSGDRYFIAVHQMCIQHPDTDPPSQVVVMKPELYDAVLIRDTFGIHCRCRPFADAEYYADIAGE